MPFELQSFPSDTALAKAVAGDWLSALQTWTKNAKPDDSYTVALSGGRIAQTFFSEIAAQAASHPSLLERVHFFWADERCVPPTDPESNYAIARRLLFAPLQIPEARIHRLRGEGPEPVALREAVENIRSVAAVNEAGGQPALDMIFLGMGEDGHVASLFPGESEVALADQSVYRAVTAVKPPPRRITLGYAAIRAARNVWVLVSGAGKQGALKESLSPAGKTPLARVLKARAQTIIFSDISPD